jgi:hypothetical protein
MFQTSDNRACPVKSRSTPPMGRESLMATPRTTGPARSTAGVGTTRTRLLFFDKKQLGPPRRKREPEQVLSFRWARYSKKYPARRVKSGSGDLPLGAGLMLL